VVSVHGWLIVSVSVTPLLCLVATSKTVTATEWRPVDASGQVSKICGAVLCRRMERAGLTKVDLRLVVLERPWR